MDRWIRWRAKGTWSLWHRAPPANAYIRRVGIAGRQIYEQMEIRDFAGQPLYSPALEIRTVYRYSACGFLIPPYEAIEEWSGQAMPPLPRCIWCVNGWVVDTAPPSGAAPAQGGAPGPIVIGKRGKKPPTQHA